MSSTISRVLSRMVIYLDRMLPYGSSIRFHRYYAANPKARRATVSLSVRPYFGWGLHLPLLLPEGRWSLKPPFHPYHSKETLPWRFISVALALESPPPDVIRHPAL